MRTGARQTSEKKIGAAGDTAAGVEDQLAVDRVGSRPIQNVVRGLLLASYRNTRILFVRGAHLKFQRTEAPIHDCFTRHVGLQNEIVADELCAPAPTLENDLTVMKGFEFEAMTETNDGGFFELRHKSSIS